MDVKALKKRVIYLESETEETLIEKGYSTYAANEIKKSFKQKAKEMRNFFNLKMKDHEM
jgi:hypothetical protein